MADNIEIENNDKSSSQGIGFLSFIALNRFLERSIFKDPELLTLLVYIALKVKRSSKSEMGGFNRVKLEVGQFVMGRTSTMNEIRITEQQYRTRVKKLIELGIIRSIKVTNQYTIYQWLENSFIDINLETPLNQPDNQQITSQSTTNNNINNTNKFSSYISSLFPNIDITNKESILRIIKKYIECKGIELLGDEIRKPSYAIKSMLDSGRTEKQIMDFIDWFKKYENNEEMAWVRQWNIETVQKKIPEFVAGKLKVKTWEEEYPTYDGYNNG